MSKAKKALVVLTTFWDADALINNGYFVFTVNNSVYQANLFTDEENKPTYTVNSVALSHPSFSKFNHIKSIDRLDFWCPTYNILNDYHKDRDWDKYIPRYEALMKKRKETIRNWIESLVPNHIYILCCWENTSKKGHCHRQLIYKALQSSSLAKEKLFPLYRDGSNKREGEAKAIPLNNHEHIMQLPSIEPVDFSQVSEGPSAWDNMPF